MFPRKSFHEAMPQDCPAPPTLPMSPKKSEGEFWKGHQCWAESFEFLWSDVLLDQKDLKCLKKQGQEGEVAFM